MPFLSSGNILHGVSPTSLVSPSAGQLLGLVGFTHISDFLRVLVQLSERLHLLLTI
jgi:hypothetical protein